MGKSELLLMLQSRSLKSCDNLTYLIVYAGSLLSCGGADEVYLLQSAWLQCLLREGSPLRIIAVANGL